MQGTGFSGNQAENRRATRRLYEPGDRVTDMAGVGGRVLSAEELTQARANQPEGKRPGHYFAPGCCARPDYVTQIPVLFEDGTYDIMRAMNIRRQETSIQKSEVRDQHDGRSEEGV
jgi:hypothetical protein